VARQTRGNRFDGAPQPCVVREPRKNATRSVAAKRVLTQPEISNNRLPLTDFEAGAVAAKIIAAYLKNNPVNTPLDLNDLSDSILDVLTGRAATNSGVNSSGPGRGKSTFRQWDLRAAIHAAKRPARRFPGSPSRAMARSRLMSRKTLPPSRGRKTNGTRCPSEAAVHPRVQGSARKAAPVLPSARLETHPVAGGARVSIIPGSLSSRTVREHNWASADRSRPICNGIGGSRNCRVLPAPVLSP